jgi:hypothetical protein
MALLNAGAAQATAPHLIVQPKGTIATSTPGQTAPSWGSTVAEINARFSEEMYDACLNNPSFKDLMLDAATGANADPYLMARFSTLVMASDQNWMPLLFECMAKNTYPGVLFSMARAFGTNFMKEWAVPYMTPSTLQIYEELVGAGVGPYPQSYYWVQEGGKLPAVLGDLYAYEVFLDSYANQRNVTYAELQAGTPKKQALNTTALYLHSTLHRSEKEAPIIILGALIGIVAAVFAIADSPTEQKLTGDLETLATEAAQIWVSVPTVVDPELDWGAGWNGFWAMNLFCLGYGDGC